MQWRLNNSSPIYLQIIDQFLIRILNGEYKPGEKIASVRDLAKEAGINPNTMQRALSMLEEKGYVVTNRTAGKTLTDDIELINNLSKNLIEQYKMEYFSKMDDIGISRLDAAEMIKEAVK
jgi:DNA-binding transcriptional regulator YhcF (GntR family)